MTRWNPNDPVILGPEPLPALGLSQLSDPDANPNQFDVILASRFRSNTAETIAELGLFGGRGGFSTENHYLIGEVLDAGAATINPATDLATDTFLPNGSSGTLVVRRMPSDEPTDLYTALDSDPPDYIEWVQVGSSGVLLLGFNTAGFSGGGRIANVGLLLTTKSGQGGTPAGSSASRTASVSFADLSGTPQGATVTKTIPAYSGTHGQALFSFGEINPVTGEPWTVADIQDFDSGTWFFRITGQTGASLLLAGAQLIVTYEVSERRAAHTAALLNDTFTLSFPGAWESVPLHEPNSSSDWSKAANTDYLLVVRRAWRGDVADAPDHDLDFVTIAGITTTGNPLVPDLGSIRVATTPYTIPATASLGSIRVPTGAADRLDLSWAFLFVTSGAAISADSQPYVWAQGVTVDAGSGAIEQDYTTVDGGEYVAARLLIRVPFYDPESGFPPPELPTDELVIEVRRRSDNVLMGTCRLAPSESPVPGFGPPVVRTAPADAPFVLAPATQYYASLSSATLVATPWELVGVGTRGGGTLYGEGTYGGNTDALDPIDGAAASTVEWAPADLALIFDAEIEPPSDFAVAAAAEPIVDPLAQCGAEGIPYAELTWTPTALGPLFGSYQIERLAPDGSTWERIAHVTDEAVAEFRDYEGRLDVQECYRLRALSALGTPSDWTATECVTVPAGGCVYTFTSNESPELSVAYADVHDRAAIRRYEFPEADEVQVRRMYGRDFQVAFRPVSTRGVVFDRELLVGAIAAPAAGVGPPAAAALRELARATLSYVTVRDSDGNRWFGSIAVPELTVRQPAQLHVAAMRFVETTSTPSTPDVAAP